MRLLHRPGPGIVFLAALLASLAGCGRDNEASRIGKLVSGIADAAEDRDVDAVLASLAADYRDFEGRDKAATRELLNTVVGSRVGIVVHILHTRPGVILPEGTASLDADVAVSSGGAEVLRKLARFIGEFLKFHIDLKKEAGTWRVSAARWEVVSPSEFFPESLPILKKLYPFL